MYIGKISIDDIAGGNNPQKAKVNKKIVNISISAQGMENSTMLEKLYPFVLDMYDKGENRGFKVLLNEELEDGKERILFILKIADDEDIYDLSIDDTSDKEHFDFILDSFFQGEFRYEIQENAEAILKRYDPKGNGKLITLVAISLVVISGILYAWSVYSEQQRLEQQRIATEAAAASARQQIVKPLNQIEKGQAKRLISKGILDILQSDVIRISSSDKLNKHASIRTITATYSEENDSIKAKWVIGYEYDYPVIETALASQSLYTNTKDYVIQKRRDDLSNITKDILTISCVESAMKIPASKVEVVARKDGEIKIKYTQMRPSDLLHNLRTYLNDCPAYIESIAMSDDKFDVQTILYHGDQ